MDSVPERDLDPEEMEEEEDVFGACGQARSSMPPVNQPGRADKRLADSSSEGSSTQTSTLTWIVGFSSPRIHDSPRTPHRLSFTLSHLHVRRSFCADTSQNWFTSLPGHDYFCDVQEDFIEDDFNLTGELRPTDRPVSADGTQGSKQWYRSGKRRWRWSLMLSRVRAPRLGTL